MAQCDQTHKKKQYPQAGNDNVRLQTSGMTFRQQKAFKKRAEDVNWQIKFSTMKLNGWQDLENGAWVSLDSLLNFAKSEQRQLNLLS